MFNRHHRVRAAEGGRWIVATALAGGLALGACSVEQTREGEMPDVDVSAKSGNLPEYEVRKTEEGEMPDVDVEAKGGQLPEYDVDTPDVDIEAEKKQVTVPDVDVDTEERTVTVPDVDVEMPDESRDEG